MSCMILRDPGKVNLNNLALCLLFAFDVEKSYYLGRFFVDVVKSEGLGAILDRLATRLDISEVSWVESLRCGCPEEIRTQITTI